MKKLIYTILCCCFIHIALAKPLPVLPAHDFHISKCQIKYSEQEQTLQISLHIFIDDLEQALAEQGVDQLAIGSELEKEDAEKYIQRYIKQCFRMTVDEEKVDYTFIGKETTKDLAAIWCYLEVEAVSEFQELIITNNLLLELFEDQKNIIHIVGPKKQEAYLMLEKGKTSDKFLFEK